EKVQRRFLKYLCYKVNGEYPTVGTDYTELCATTGIEELLLLFYLARDSYATL
ncbi:GSCOCG00007234001-RA-CDS, partial [Cotesia congregata]